jgi:hypothetical protein
MTAKICTQEMLGLAKRKPEEFSSKRKVATELGINESAVRKCIKAGSGVTALGRYKTVFTTTQESKLAEHCKNLDDRFYALNLQTLRKLGYEF